MTREEANELLAAMLGGPTLSVEETEERLAVEIQAILRNRDGPHMWSDGMSRYGMQKALDELPKERLPWMYRAAAASGHKDQLIRGAVNYLIQHQVVECKRGNYQLRSLLDTLAEQ